jgi:hypothetical protein
MEDALNLFLHITMYALYYIYDELFINIDLNSFLQIIMYADVYIYVELSIHTDC